MQYIQGTTTAVALAPHIAAMNEINRLRRENARLQAENDALHELMYSAEEQQAGDGETWKAFFLNACDRIAQVLMENEELRAGLAAIDQENTEIKSALLRALAR